MADIFGFVGSEPSTTQAQNDARYLRLAGGTMTGDEIFPLAGFIMTDANGAVWRVTIDTSGAIKTTATTLVVTGNPLCYFFFVYTYS